MEPKDWLQLITSWVSIAVTIWLGLRDVPPPEGRHRKRSKKVPAIPTSRNPIQSYQGVPRAS